MCGIPSIKPCFVKIQTLPSRDNLNKTTTEFISADQILLIDKEESPVEPVKYIAHIKGADNEIQEIELDPKIANTFNYIA